MPTVAPIPAPSRIVVVQSAFLGDVVLTTPLLRALRRAAPVAELVVVLTPRSAGIAPCLPWVDRVVVWPKRAGVYGLRELWRMGQRLRRERYDVAIAAQRSVRSGIVLALSGARRRIGLAGSQGAWAYSDRVRWDPSVRAARRLLHLAGPLGTRFEEADDRPELGVPPGIARSADAKLEGLGVSPHSRIVAIAPGSAWDTKRWTLSGFSGVAVEAVRAGASAVLLGSPEERDLCERIRSLAGRGVVVAAGRLDLPETVAALSRAAVAVGNDSGLSHAAAAVGTPVVAVFGPTVPRQGLAPHGDEVAVIGLETLECRPCGTHGAPECPLGHHRCMQDLPVEPVANAMLAALAQAQTRPG